MSGEEATQAPSRPRAAEIATLVLVAVAAAMATGFAGLISYVAFYDAPFWDHWDHVDRDRLLSGLLARNNEHPMVVSRLFFWLDDRLLHATGRFLQAVTIALLLAQVGVFVWLARMVGIARPELRVGLAAAAFVLAAFGFEALIWPFELSLAAAFTCGAAAPAAFASHVRTGSRVALIASLVAATLGVLSLANGVLIPTLLAAMALALGRRKAAVAFAALAVVAWTWQLAAPGEFSLPIARIGDLLAHFLAQLGAPVGFALGYLYKMGGPVIPDLPVAIAAGLLVLALAGVLLVHVWRQKRGDAAFVALAAIIVFSLATAALTAVGRFEYGAAQALSSRYNVNAALLYSAITALGLASLKDAPALLRIALSWAAPAGALMLVVIAATGAPVLHDLGGRHREALSGVTALVAGVRDLDAIGRLAARPDMAISESEKFRKNGTWFFADASARRVGEKLMEPSPARCPGSIWKASPPDLSYGYRRADGAFARSRASAGAAHVLVVDAESVIVGYGRVPRRASDLFPWSRNDGRVIDWGGHVRALAAGPLRAFLADAGKVRCRLGTWAP